MRWYNVGKREEDKVIRKDYILRERFGRFVGMWLGKRCKIKKGVEIMPTSLWKSLISVFGPRSLASNVFRMEVNGAKMLPEFDWHWPPMNLKAPSSLTVWTLKCQFPSHSITLWNQLNLQVISQATGASACTMYQKTSNYGQTCILAYNHHHSQTKIFFIKMGSNVER